MTTPKITNDPSIQANLLRKSPTVLEKEGQWRSFDHLKAPAKGLAEPIFVNQLTPEEIINKTESDTYKLIGAAAKFQDPENPKGPENVAQTVASLQGTKAILKSATEITKLVESLNSNELTKSLDYIGKSIIYDNSEQEFNGKDLVQFTYQIRNPHSNSLPNKTTINSTIVIYNQAEQEVRRQEVKTNRLGKHTYSWDGKDETGNSCVLGKYRIAIKSYYEEKSDKNFKRIELDAGAMGTGVVKMAEAGQDGKAVLHIKEENSNEIIEVDLSKISRVLDSIPKAKTPKLEDYASYIGKTASITHNSFTVKEAISTIDFVCPIDRPGRAHVIVYDKNDQIVAHSVIKEVNPRNNVSVIECYKTYSLEEAEQVLQNAEKFRPLSNGHYFYELYIEDTTKEGQNRWTNIDLNRQVEITGLDFNDESGYLLSGDKRYPISEITRLSNDPVSAMRMFNEGTQYINKKARINHFMEFKGNSHQQEFQLPKLRENEYYKNITIQIFNEDDQLISQVSKNGSTIFDQNSKWYDTTLGNYDAYLPTSEQIKEILMKANLILPVADSPTKFILPASADNIQIDLPDNFNDYLATMEANAIDEDQISITKTMLYNAIADYREANPAALRLNYEEIYKHHTINQHFNNLSQNDQADIIRAIDENKMINYFTWNGKDMNHRAVDFGNYYIKVVAEIADSISENKIEVLDNLIDVYITSYENKNNDLYLNCYKFAENSLDNNGEDYIEILGDPIQVSQRNIKHLYLR